MTASPQSPRRKLEKARGVHQSSLPSMMRLEKLLSIEGDDEDDQFFLAQAEFPRARTKSPPPKPEENVPKEITPITTHIRAPQRDIALNGTKNLFSRHLERIYLPRKNQSSKKGGSQAIGVANTEAPRPRVVLRSSSGRNLPLGSMKMLQDTIARLNQLESQDQTDEPAETVNIANIAAKFGQRQSLSASPMPSLHTDADPELPNEDFDQTQDITTVIEPNLSDSDSDFGDFSDEEMPTSSEYSSDDEEYESRMPAVIPKFLMELRVPSTTSYLKMRPRGNTCVKFAPCDLFYRGYSASDFREKIVLPRAPLFLPPACKSVYVTSESDI